MAIAVDSPHAEASVSELVQAANLPMTDPARHRVIGAAASGDLRFELYHFALSFCSHKVRTVLAEKGLPYRSHDIGILPPLMENYHPDYVRLRLRGRAAGPFVNGYSGRSSTSSEGFDPCVVPTLVDHATNQVLVDSRLITAHIDQHSAPANSLYPARLKAEIDRQIAVVDSTPHPAVLYGAHPDGDFRPELLRQNMPGAHDYKIMRLMEARALVVGNVALTSAYDAKIRKEAAARHFVHDAELMRGATREIVDTIGQLEETLADGRDFVCGETYTMADIHWAVSLFRLQWLGMAFCWTGSSALNRAERPRVAAYAKRLFARESFRQAVIHWPGNPPSEYVAEYYDLPAGDEAEQSLTEQAGLKGHGRDIREENLTEVVRATFADTPNPRTRQVFDALTRHLHAFIEEVEPTEQEWEQGIDFLTRTGQLSDDKRQEVVLLSDVLGVTARVDLQTHRFPAGATVNSVLGPFFMQDRPTCHNGAEISGGVPGEPLLASFRVLNTKGEPVVGARVDIWHSDGAGAYDVMMPNLKGTAMRGLFRADGDGRVWFTSILPTSYPIPNDGPVGELLRASARSIIRPGHLHVRIEAPGYRRLTTMLFTAGDYYMDADPVFGVKEKLVVPFEQKKGLRSPDGVKQVDPCYLVEYDFVLASVKT